MRTALAVNFLGLVLLTGCGGGGGSTSTQSPIVDPTPTPTPVVTPTPAPTPTPTPVPTPDVSAKDRSIAANFAPNYIPANSARYLHWADNKNIRIFIYPSVNNVVDKTPVTNIETARSRGAVQDAINYWEAASTADFDFTLVDAEADADIKIYFVDQIRRLNGTVTTGVGLANYSFSFPNSGDNTRGILENAVVQILASQPDANLADTITHEIGHALGIETHSEDPNDLLFATSLPPTVITQRDQNSLFYLYYSPTAVNSAPVTSRRKSAVQTSEIVCGTN